jgi:site-specific recombinase XerC
MSGQLIKRRAGFSARYWTEVDGVRVRVCTPLNTDNRTVALAKMKRLLQGEAQPETVVQAETFQQAAERIHEQRVTDGVASAADELSRLRLYAFASMGGASVTELKFRHVNAALDDCKALGKSRQTVAHLRQAIRVVFEALKREGSVSLNPADEASMPRFPDVVRKERAVLTDAELATYLAFVHPQELWQMAVRERQVMACVARCFGGLRTGDLHALLWESFDVGPFTYGWAPRRKTKRPQLIEVPAMLRPFLRGWWQAAGSPQTGLVFPARRGARAGEKKIKVSHARAFRRDLRRAFGVETWNAKEECFKRARELTARERELFEVTPHTLPVDFHSWRRAFSQALANADVNAQEASALAGHASLSAHARYLASAGRKRTIPNAALPQWAPFVPDPLPSGKGPSMKEARRTGLEPAASGVTGHEAADLQALSRAFPLPSDLDGLQKSPRCPSAVPADAALKSYLRELADAIAARLPRALAPTLQLAGTTEHSKSPLGVMVIG